jgi:hypothetical protein
MDGYLKGYTFFQSLPTCQILGLALHANSITWF